MNDTAQKLMDRGLACCVNDKMQEFREYVALNSDDGYSLACVKAQVAVMERLAAGKPADKTINTEVLYKMDLTGFMAGCAIQAAVYYSPRGDELKRWWNKDYGGTGEEVGVVNPAILTISKKKGATK